MSNQFLLFGVANPHRAHADGAHPATRDAPLRRLCHHCRQSHLPLAWLRAARLLLPAPPLETAAPVALLGIVIAARDPDRLPFGHLVHPLFAPICAAPPLDDVLDLRLIGGLPQALIDWEIVRLTAGTIPLALGPGQLWLAADSTAA